MTAKSSAFFLLFFLLSSFDGFCQGNSVKNLSENLNYKQGKVSSIPQPDTSGIDFHYLSLSISANDTNTTIKGSAYYLGKATRANLSSIVLDLSNAMTIDSLFLDSMKGNFTHSNNLLFIFINSSYPVAHEFSLQIYYHGSSVYGGFFTGLSSAKDLNYHVPVTWTLSEPFGARDWFPAKQVLTDKIDSSDMFISVPPNCKAGSNGLLEEIISMPDGSNNFHWKSRYPIDYYLISFTVAAYQDYSIYSHPEGSTKPLLVQNFIYNLPDVLPAFKAGIDRTPAFIELFASLFGPYPFDNEKYGHCLAPINGGMEHQTMTTLSNFEFGLVSHELCHMWFGDHITCGSWQDIWLNEGFATYGEFLAHSMFEGFSSGQAWLKNAHDEAMQTAGGSIYIPVSQINDENRIFNDQLSYKKAGSVLHMLRNELNDDNLFFSILREYGRRFAYSTATTDDFRGVVESLAARDFQWFFDQWIYGEGYPTINVSWNQKSNILSINTQQIPSSSTPLFKTSMDIRINRDAGDTIVRIWIDDLMNHFEFNLQGEATSVDADPFNALLKRTSVFQLPDAVDFKIGPNPFSQDPLQVNFYTGSKPRLFTITDLNGKKISEFTSVDRNVQIGSGLLNRGVYILNIQDGEKSWQVKIIRD